MTIYLEAAPNDADADPYLLSGRVTNPWHLAAPGRRLRLKD
jgi:hypothetical protein